MKNLRYKLAAGAASAAMLAATMAPPVFAQTDLRIVGNGNKSDNKIVHEEDCTTILNQNNDSDVDVDLDLVSNTGDNEANKNTTNGGDVEVDTGDATIEGFVTVQGSGNHAEDVPDCCECNGGAVSKLIKDNGNRSRNRVINSTTNTSIFRQTNSLNANVTALMKPRTGGNRANKNTTGGGKVEVKTGNSLSFFDVFVSVNPNTLLP